MNVLAKKRAIVCIRSLESEAVDLSDLLLVVLQNSEDHRLTASGMCKRNIQLASELDGANKTVSEANDRMARMRFEMDSQQDENLKLRNKNDGHEQQNTK